MSSIKTKLFRSEDHQMLQVKLDINSTQKYEYAMVSFKCGGESIDILSTSLGSINQDGELKLFGISTEIYVEYCETDNELECLVGYYIKNKLKYYETLTSQFDNTKRIENTQVSVPLLRTIPGSYQERLDDFLDALQRRKSSWKIEVSCPDDILIKVKKSGKNPIMVAWGEDSANLMVSDLIFKVYPDLETINIPKDLTRKNYEQYSEKAKLGIFEIIEPDFVGIKNVFFKSLISNTLSLSGLAT